jgi:phytoene dehydrogenase-like protein
MSYSPSPNPLRQVLDAIEEDVTWVNYDTWGCCLPEGDFFTTVGAEQFTEVLHRFCDDRAVAEWRELQQVMYPLAQAAIALPPLAIRYDWAALASIGSFFPALLRQAPSYRLLTGAFSRVMDRVITDPFIRNWLDLLCFLLSGLPADSTNAAEMAFMFADWYRPEVKLDYPIGGSGAIVAALVRGLEKYGGELRLNTHVGEILVEGDRAVGVKLKHGKEIRATQAVVTNASVWDTLKLLPAGAIPPVSRQQQQATPACNSFLHLHLGIDASGLPENLPCHYIFVDDWSKGITTPQNVIVLSIPSLLDPSLAPPGKHNIHVYTPANEPYHLWERLERNSPAYRELKQQRGEAMWGFLERVIPDIRARCEVSLMGTPLTHERFLRRHRGSYGPALSAAKGLFPTGRTPLRGLFACGDSTFPGIGLPAVAASGAIVANTLVPVSQHRELLRRVIRG